MPNRAARIPVDFLVAGMRDRHAKHRHDGIPAVGVDDAAVRFHQGRHALRIFVDPIHQLRRIHVFGDGRIILQVGEEHGGGETPWFQPAAIEELLALGPKQVQDFL